MPLIKSAIKKLRQDRKREIVNDAKRAHLKKVLKKAQKEKTEKSLSEAFSVVDKAVKNELIHKNKAARIKSSLSHLLSR